MTLGELIKEIPLRTMFRVGSSSGWLFIGNKQEWGSNFKELERNELNTLLEREKFYTEEIAKPKNWKQDYHKKQISAYETVKKKIAEFRPFEEREIIDTYRSHEGDLCIKVEGNEKGKYSTRGEYIGVPEDEAYRDFIRKRYKLEHSKVIPVADLYDPEGYQMLREDIVCTFSKRYMRMYKQYLIEQSEKRKRELQEELGCMELTIMNDSFAVYLAGIQPKALIDTMKRRMEKEVNQ